ncbi:carboxypeptidase regulatory-like domain-containing protein [bacterium]
MKVRRISNLYKAALAAVILLAVAGCGDMKGKNIPYYPPEGNVEGFVYSKVYNENSFARKITILRVAGRTVPDGYVPVEGAAVTCQDTEDTNFSDTTDADGRFFFQDVAAGDQTVQVSKNGQTTTFTITVVKDATTVANDSEGDDSLTLAPASTGGLVVTASADCQIEVLAPAEADVYIKGPGQSDFFKTNLTTPTATFSDIATGDYSVKLLSSDYETSSSQDTTISADNIQNLSFSLTPTNTNLPPYAQITTPATDNSRYIEGLPVVLTGGANDCEDGALTGASLAWTSSIDGALGNDISVTTSSLSVATHTITLTATDSDSNTHSDTATIVIIENEDPTATISSPLNGAEYSLNATVNFGGTGADTEDGLITTASQLVWTSSIDDQIGTGPGFSKNDLSSGDHTITLTVTDSFGNTDTATVDITVTTTVSQTAPTAAILFPNIFTGTTFTSGAQINFVGVGQDTEDGVLADANLAWASSIDGTLGTGATLQKSGLSVGTHIITLTVIDSDNMTGQATVTITVN